MNTPSILGRMEDDTYIDARASTELLHSVDVPFEGGAVGKVTVSAFKDPLHNLFFCFPHPIKSTSYKREFVGNWGYAEVP